MSCNPAVEANRPNADPSHPATNSPNASVFTVGLSHDASAAAYVSRQFQQVATTNESLQRELSRAYDRLNVVLEISDNSSYFENPAEMEAALLNRYAKSLDAALLLLDRGDTCQLVHVREDEARTLGLTPSETRARLVSEIEVVRRTGRACRLNRSQASERGLDKVHVLLSAFQTDSDVPHVLIALRGGDRPPFDNGDQLTSETVLVYGGHILRNALMVKRLQQVSLETVGALANAIEARDKYTGGHSERVGWLAVLTGKALELPAADIQMLEWSGLLHDVGKIGIPEHILNKPGELTTEEFEQIKMHPRLGYDVLQPVSSLKPVLDAVLCHHENHDGSGYPQGLRAEQIPLLARVLHVVDIFDALTSTRSYRAGLTVREALAVLADGADRVTDPTVTAAFVGAFDRYVRAEPEDFSQRFAHL
jgi:HD-GYP domain-containing protein (c-di-GMP phosphodiesterase class II)